MNNFTVGVLTISDRCHRNEAVDESGPTLVGLIQDGVVKNATVVKTHLVPDCQEDIKRVLKQWCLENVALILTTGGTGLSERDVTPEATAAVIEKAVPGISQLILSKSFTVTPLAALSRGIAGIRGRSLIINLPGSKKGCEECLKAVACVIPHAIDLINDWREGVERVHLRSQIKRSGVLANRIIDRCRESPYPLITVSKAQEIILQKINILRREKYVDWKEALGHALVTDVVAMDNHPPMDLSLKDGYAVITEDKQMIKSLVGVSYMGEPPPDFALRPGGCVRVSTGGSIPPCADAVVKVEDTEIQSLNDELNEEKKIMLKTLPVLNENIRKKGSEYTRGDLLLKHGTFLNSAALGLLAAAGITTVKVFQKPVVTIMSTGDELQNPHEHLKWGRVRDSNRIMLMSLLRTENFEAQDLGIIPDDPNLLRDALEKGFRAGDIVVTTGSMSMGERDYLKEVISTDFNGEICFGRILMKPGMPTSFGLVTFEGKPKVWFGLPGNPASAFVTSHLFLLPALRNISGCKEVFPSSILVTNIENLPNSEDRPHYVRCKLQYEEPLKAFKASVLQNQSSCWIGNCVDANGLILLPTSSSASSNWYQVFIIGKI